MRRVRVSPWPFSLDAPPVCPDPKPSRPEAVRPALKDWLTGLGLLKD